MSCDPNVLDLYSYSEFTFVGRLSLCKIEPVLHLSQLSSLNLLKNYSPA